MRFWRDESGQALVLAILAMSMLLGFMALAVDVGTLFRARRAVQTAADAAAIAAALDYKYNGASATNTSVANAASAANGYTNGSGGVVVTTRIPPVDGPNLGAQGFAEVTVSAPNPTFFMSLFNYKNIPVGARAVAGHGTTENCMYLLGATGADFDNTGAATIDLTNCGLVDDSSSGNALSNTGALTMSASSIGIVGGSSNSGAETLTPTPTTGITPSGDPLNRTPPSTAGCGAALSYPTAVTTTVTQGCYDGLSVTAAANLTFSPGLYVINGPIVLTGAATLKGTGVTFYFNGATTLNGSAVLQFSAPTTGTWNGIVFYEDPADANTFALTGATTSNLQGIIYLPNATLDLTGATSMTLYTAFVVKQLRNTGAISLTLNDYLTKNPSSPLAVTTLVE
ncbi:MAG: TadE/TadG family type IV pilus assembly protein [Terracidiphilus sp.]